MVIQIEIPKEFEKDFERDRFNDSLQRIKYETKVGNLVGRYDMEVLDMLIKAFKNSSSEHDSVCIKNT